MLKFFGRTTRLNARFGLLILLLILVVSALFFFNKVLLPFMLAIFLAFLLSPVIDWVNSRTIAKRHIPRGVGIMGVYVVILGLVVLSGFYLVPRFYMEFKGIVKTLPNALHEVEKNIIAPAEQGFNTLLSEFVGIPVLNGGNGGSEANGANENTGEDSVNTQNSAQNPVQGEGSTPQNGTSIASSSLEPILDNYTFIVRRHSDDNFEIIPKRREFESKDTNRSSFRFDQQITQFYRQFSTGFEENFVDFVKLGREAISKVVGSVFTLFLVLMISGFLLVDPKRVSEFNLSLVPSQYQESYGDWLRKLDRGLSGVVRGQAVICLVNGVLTGIGIAILGVPYVATLSVIAAIFSLIPIFGVLISTVPIVLMAMTVSFTTAALSIGWILLIHFFEGNFLNPKILGDSARIHPVLIVFALVVGQHFGGVLGALLAVPLFSLIQNSFLFLKLKAESLEKTG